MYSDMSKRISSTPMMKASWRATSVLPTPVGPENRKLPIGFWGLPRPLRAILIAAESASIALSWPNTTAFRSRSRFFSADAIVARDVARRNARDLGDDLLDLGLADHLLLLRLGQDALQGTGLVDHVDRLVGQVAVVDVARRQLRRRGERVGGVLHAVVRLEARLQAAQDLDGLLDRRLVHVDLLEAARQRMVLLEDAADTRCRWSRRCTSARPTTARA